MPIDEISNTDLNSIKIMLAYLCVKDLEGLPQKIEVLDQFDLTDIEKANVCNVKVQTIRNTRSKSKKISKTEKDKS